MKISQCMILLFLFGCSSAVPVQDRPQDFTAQLVETWIALWKYPVAPKIKNALSDYFDGREVSPGVKLGEKVRVLDIRNQTIDSVRKLALKNGFRFVECPFWDFSKTPNERLPERLPERLKDERGEFVPLWVFIHTDGSKIRVKPKGDPKSKYRPFPDATKSLVFPPGSDPCDYSNEVFLIDHQGLPLPKQPGALSSVENSSLYNEWAERTHSRLLPKK